MFDLDSDIIHRQQIRDFCRIKGGLCKSEDNVNKDGDEKKTHNQPQEQEQAQGLGSAEMVEAMANAQSQDTALLLNHFDCKEKVAIYDQLLNETKITQNTITQTCTFQQNFFETLQN